MLLADEGLRTDEGTKGKDAKAGTEELVKNFLQIHESCTDKDAAPRRYMTFLKTYKQVYNEKKDGVVKRQQHLQVCTKSQSWRIHPLRKVPPNAEVFLQGLWLWVKKQILARITGIQKEKCC